MTTPFVLKIDHRNIEVKVLPPGYDDTAAGLYEACNSAILIDARISPQEQARVLLHEILHAVWDIRNMPKNVTEELACGLLDGALATVIRDNPILLPMLGGALNYNRDILA